MANDMDFGICHLNMNFWHPLMHPLMQGFTKAFPDQVKESNQAKSAKVTCSVKVLANLAGIHAKFIFCRPLLQMIKSLHGVVAHKYVQIR